MTETEGQGTLFDERFLGRYAGSIMSDPTTALVELVANAWDAYATEVVIQWPDKETGSLFQIRDNGIGMTSAEFEERWRTLEYNRLVHQGEESQPPADLVGANPRPVYGRNGRGRHAAFFFSSPYRVRTWKDGTEATYLVSQGKRNPIEISRENLRQTDEIHGTEIAATLLVSSTLTPPDVRAILSTRFLMDPSFSVSVDGIRVTFDDIPPDYIQEVSVEVEGHGVATVLVIDSQRPDKTTRQHGVAWWVNRRLVGQAGWHIFDDRLIDGRTEEAKRYTFIVNADFLANSVLPDWSNFSPQDSAWQVSQPVIQRAIADVIHGITREKRSRAKETVRAAHAKEVSALPVLSQDRWNKFLDEVVESCPSLTETQIDQVMGLLANLELSNSQYSLLEKLHQLSPGELDDWNDVLQEWTIQTAKVALDEISRRLRLIEEIRAKTADTATDEVQDLQPLFGQALWIFGPQFESLEFTSNLGMTRVIRQLFGKDDTGSRNRPDFVVLPDSTLGFYSRPSFDSSFNELGTEVLVIVELKKPGVAIGTEEKSQVWKYVKELLSKGYVTDRTQVYGYALGDLIDPTDTGERREGDRVVIRPMLYSTFIGQAEKRMLNLHRRLVEAPFMKEALKDIPQPIPVHRDMFGQPSRT